jgi:ubiquinone/menaquinone biosynthesis C-methylase UbiE
MRIFSSLQPQLPIIANGARRILDLGCGDRTVFEYFQAPVMACSDISCPESMAGRFHFTVCSAEHLDFADEVFDLIVCRVAIPYMLIPVALREIHRVLAPGGKLWATLHLPRMAFRRIRADIWRGDVKDILFQSYVLLNCLLAHFLDFQLKWIDGHYESVQTPFTMRRALKRAGFVDVITEIVPDAKLGRKHFGVQASASKQC